MILDTRGAGRFARSQSFLASAPGCGATAGGASSGTGREEGGWPGDAPAFAAPVIYLGNVFGREQYATGNWLARRPHGEETLWMGSCFGGMGYVDGILLLFPRWRL